MVKDGKSGPGAFHALWTMHGLGAFTAAKGEAFDAAKAALASADAGRPPRGPGGDAAHGRGRRPRSWRPNPLTDADATVRLEALLALERNAGVEGGGGGRDGGRPRPEERRRPVDSVGPHRRSGPERHGVPGGRDRGPAAQGGGSDVHTDDPRRGRTSGASRPGRRGGEAAGGAEIGGAGVGRTAAGRPGGRLAARRQADAGRRGFGRPRRAGGQAAAVRPAATGRAGQALGPGEADGGARPASSATRP